MINFLKKTKGKNYMTNSVWLPLTQFMQFITVLLFSAACVTAVMTTEKQTSLAPDLHLNILGSPLQRCSGE
jgi:hypothetical protein